MNLTLIKWSVSHRLVLEKITELCFKERSHLEATLFYASQQKMTYLALLTFKLQHPSFILWALMNFVNGMHAWWHIILNFAFCVLQTAIDIWLKSERAVALWCKLYFVIAILNRGLIFRMEIVLSRQ